MSHVRSGIPCQGFVNFEKSGKVRWDEMGLDFAHGATENEDWLFATCRTVPVKLHGLQPVAQFQSSCTGIRENKTKVK